MRQGPMKREKYRYFKQRRLVQDIGYNGVVRVERTVAKGIERR